MEEEARLGPAAEHTPTALLVVDLQMGLFRRPRPVYHADELLENISTLVERAQCAGSPVFYTQHATQHLLVEGSSAWALHPRLQPLAPDRVIHKRHNSAFRETTLVAELEQHAIGRVVVTGLVTQGCVKATCLDGKRLGYEVVLVEDGHSNFAEEADQVIEEWNEKMKRRGIEVKSTRVVAFTRSLVL